jgi:hypothetical protein
LLCLFLPRRGCCMQNSFLHATTKLISSWFGPGQLWPCPSGWLWLGPLLFLKTKQKKNPKNFKNHLKKSWFSQIFFYSFCIISGCIFTL